MLLIDVLKDFRIDVANCNALITFALSRYASGGYKHQRGRREFIMESAFLKIFISWETFLERAFHSYMQGETSVLGVAPVKYVNPIDENHAKKILIGTQKYVDWSNPEIVRKLSKLYFQHGFVINSTLSAIQADIFDMRTIRNSAAHMSSTTSAALDALGTRLLSKPCVNIKPTDLLMSIDPANTPDTILDTYNAKLDVAAELIAKG